MICEKTLEILRRFELELRMVGVAPNSNQVTVGVWSKVRKGLVIGHADKAGLGHDVPKAMRVALEDALDKCAPEWRRFQKGYPDGSKVTLHEELVERHIT